MSALFRIIELNGRHTAHECFSHMVEFKLISTYLRNRAQRPVGVADIRFEFYSMMKWCWETLGPGAELTRDSVFYAHYEKKAYQLNVKMSSTRIEKILEIADVKWGWFIEGTKHRIYLKDEAVTLLKLKWEVD